MPRFWLFKSEPDVFSIDDLAASKGKRTTWEGVRNYQVRNLLRDEISRGDGVLFYHSRIDPMVIAGTATVVTGGYPDSFAMQPDHKYYDPRCSAENPVWYMVDIRLARKFKTPVTRSMLQQDPVCEGMAVLKKGSRLSITPVTEAEWHAVHALAGERLADE
ncbi:MAG: EVE domain-containing protein [Planctomycetaceae bacterium]|nr:EVE domain-containing protein [Planctomycetaceae bacterium]